jgi:hypothetical protein
MVCQWPSVPLLPLLIKTLCRITTKLDNTWHHVVEEGITSSLKSLQTDYIDLYLMHWPSSTDPKDKKKHLPDWDFIKTWAEMQKLPASGRVRSRSMILTLALSGILIVHEQISAFPTLASRTLRSFSTIPAAILFQLLTRLSSIQTARLLSCWIIANRRASTRLHTPALAQRTVHWRKTKPYKKSLTLKGRRQRRFCKSAPLKT